MGSVGINGGGGRLGVCGGLGEGWVLMRRVWWGVDYMGFIWGMRVVNRSCEGSWLVGGHVMGRGL